MLTPFALGAAIGGIASGRVPVGNAAGDLFSSWLNPTSILIGVLAVATAAYLAAVYLAADAAPAKATARAGRRRGRRRGRGRRPGGAALRRPSALPGLLAGAGLAALIVSGLAGVATLALVYRRRFEPARYSAALAVAAIIAGWALAQQPGLAAGPDDPQAAARTTRWSR